MYLPLSYVSTSQPVITLSNAHVDIGVDVDDTNGFNVNDFIDCDLPTLAVCYSGVSVCFIVIVLCYLSYCALCE